MCLGIPGQIIEIVDAENHLAKVEVNGVRLDAGDGTAIRDEPTLRVRALDDAELVLVDTTA